jgi:hypothetical protein
LIAGLLPGFIDRYADRLDPELICLGERLMPKVEAWMTEHPQAWTVQHGDYRLDNMLFGGPGSRRPLAVVDWQTATYVVRPSQTPPISWVPASSRRIAAPTSGTCCASTTKR